MADDRAVRNPEWSELNPSLRQIRLFYLKPGRYNDRISGRLVLRSLNDKPHYYALSYVWASPPTKARICLGGPAESTHNRSFPDTKRFQLEVPSNLDDFLRSLRARNQNHWLPLWADAICINQADSAEKQHQIPLMGSSYREALVSWAWIGQDAKSIWTAATTLEALGSGIHLEQALAENVTKHSRPVHDFLTAAHGWCQNPFWSRVWTLQEICLPRHVVLHCSSLTCDLNELCKAVEAFMLHQECCVDGFLSGHNMSAVSRSERSAILQAVFELLQLLTRIVEAREHWQKRTPETALDIAAHIGERNCLDARDFIYGIMGMVPDLKIPVDYEASVQSVFCRAAAAFISSTLSLNIFATTFGRQRQYVLPSWVPNWGSRVEDGQEWQLGWQSVSFSASRGSKARFSLFADELISVAGYRIGTISATSSGIFQGLSANRAIIDDWKARTVGPRSNIDSLEGFWRVLLQDMSVQSVDSLLTRATDEDVSQVATWWEEIESGTAQQESSESTSMMNLNLMLRHENKQLFRTQSGDLGVARQSARIDDEVWVFRGADVPFVVRPWSAHDSVSVLISEAYLHGFMDGEALDGMLTEEKCLLK